MLPRFKCFKVKINMDARLALESGNKQASEKPQATHKFFFRKHSNALSQLS